METTRFTNFCRTQKNKLTAVAAALLLTVGASHQATAQEDKRVGLRNRTESFGHTLNVGVGIAYFGYIGSSVPFLNLNYEINVARNFTLAPSIGFASYRSYDNYYWAGSRYYYHETIMPIGLKGTYYFDELLGANSKWDFYLAATLGFTVHTISWDNGYNGDRNAYGDRSYLYLLGHIGAEYHVSRNVGLFLDLSSGVSTFGLGFHHL